MQRLLGSSSALLLSALLAFSSTAPLAAETKSAAPAPATTAVPAKPRPDLKTQADGGNAAAALKFALPLLAPNRSPTDLAEGLKYLQLAADAKLPEANLRLGDAYRSGSFGLVADPNQAITYYQRAADAGNVGALGKLADLYRNGATGLPKDPARAFGLYKHFHLYT
jgi:localization factor PodJL